MEEDYSSGSQTLAANRSAGNFLSTNKDMIKNTADVI